MIPSRYNIYFDHKGKEYIYNTLSCAIVSCDDKSIQLLKSNQIYHIPKDVLNILIKNGLIVKKDFDELKAYQYYYNSVQYNQAPEELRLVVLPTYKCNLRCTYCFEEDCKELNDKLDETKISQIVSFVNHELTNPLRHYKKVALTLFGGEPFLYPKECAILLREISQIAGSHNLGMKVSAITNGTLITDQIIEELIKPYNIRLQITLDGMKPQHDKKRKYANGKGTFEEIVGTINHLNQHGCAALIDLRLNVDHENIESIETIFSEFGDKTGYMYVGLLRPAGHNSCNADSCVSDNDYLTKIRPNILKTIRKYKAATRFIPFGKQRPCALVRVGCFIIDPSLTVYKCDNLVGRKEYAVGHICDGKLVKGEQYYTQAVWTPFDNQSCLNCKLLPACGKSCAYKCLLAKGDMNTHACSMNESQLIDRVKSYLDEQDME